MLQSLVPSEPGHVDFFSRSEYPSTTLAKSHVSNRVWKQLDPTNTCRHISFNSRWATIWRCLTWGILACTGGVGISLCEVTLAQSAASREYMESSSPLKKGGVVTSRSLPGQAVQTTITRTAMTTGPAANSAGARPLTETSVLSNASPAAGGNSTTATASSDPANLAPVASSTVSEYPYPLAPPIMTPNWNGAGGTGGSPALQLPTLGITPNSALRPRWGRWPANNTWGGQSTLVPDFGSRPPGAVPADLPPSINYPQNEWMSPGGGSGLNGPPPANFWQNQSVYGNGGSNNPAIRWRNMPPGTYLGQGLVGQPKAYVDGQPIRNLLRFLAPF